MATARALRCVRGVLVGLLLYGLTGAPLTQAAAPDESADDTYLDALQGKWAMDGMFGGKPVRYSADGQRVLRGAFMKLHMLDLGSPSQYEADVFMGFDPKANDYVVHWLDRFGAAGARVVGRGERRGQQLILVFPYPEGAFRDTFTWLPAAGSWSLLLESQGADGAWSTFATYTLTRPVHQ